LYSEEQVDGETMKTMITRTSTAPFFFPVFNAPLAPALPLPAADENKSTIFNFSICLAK
jgi:hypothetical protein